MVDGTVCCICLESPKIDSPLKLINCGCKGAWFHDPCLHTWAGHARTLPYTCPTCRRIVPLKTNYSFHYQGGDEQQYLWHTLGLFVGEVICVLASSMRKELYILPFQTSAIFLQPFMMPSGQTYPYFLFHVRLRYYVLLCDIALCLGNEYSLQQKVVLLTFPGYLHLVTLWLVAILNVQHRHPLLHRDIFEDYAISREILIAETSADARERDEGGATPAGHSPEGRRGGRRHRHNRR